MNAARAVRSALVCAAITLPARASDQIPFRIDYRPGLSCPGPEHFASQLAARTRRLTPAWPGAPALTFIVQVSETETAVEGRLTLVEPNGATTERTVPGSNCIEVLDAMALIAAVSVDPSASLEPRVEPRPAVAPAPVATPRKPRPPKPATRGGWGAGTALSVESNLAPEPLPALGLYAELAGRGRGAWAPYARAGLHRAQSPSIEVPDSAPAQLRRGHSQLTWLSGRLLGCPVALRLEPFVARPCASFDLGVLRGQGYVQDAPTSESTVWMAAGVAADAEVVIERRLLVGFDAGLATTLRRGTFFLDPPLALQNRVLVHEIEPLAWHAGLRVGFRFF